MRKILITGGTLAILLFLLLARRPSERAPVDAPPVATAPARPRPSPATEAEQGFLYGRVSTVDGTVYEGRLRWGGDDEAFWDDYFQGFEDENPWAAQLPPELLVAPQPIEVFGIEIARIDRPVALGRPFMARFGDIARIEAQGRDIRVTLKSGTLSELDRFEADDLADGLRIWDTKQGVVDIDEGHIRRIELLPTVGLDAVPGRLQGTVRTRQGDFRGFIQWDWGKRVETDRLQGDGPEGEMELLFESIRSIARRSPDSALVTLLDGREIELTGSPEAGLGNRGTFVEDRRYGRVLIAWESFERADFRKGGSGPAYDNFPPGRPLTGSVTTRAGRQIAGRLVYDLDEGETTETLDAPAQGLHYSIPFGLIASIQIPDREAGDEAPAQLILHGGETLRLERAGDLGPENGGLLVFGESGEQPAHLPWAEVARIDLDRPPAMFPPISAR